MKIRARIQQPTKKTVTITLPDVDGSQPTLAQLKQSAFSSLGADPALVYISLNGASPLEGDDKTLNELGIVSGDLVLVLWNDPSIYHEKQESTVASSTGDSHKKVKVCHDDTNSSKNSDQIVPSEKCDATSAENQDMDVSASTSTSETIEDDGDGIKDSEVNKYLMEPMLIRESTMTSIPQVLINCYHCSEIQKSGDALCVVIHVLMFESGFRCQVGDEVQKSADQLTGSWRDSGVYRLKYVHSVSDGIVYELMIVPMGSLLIIHGLLKDTQGNIIPIPDKIQMKLRLQDYYCENAEENVALKYKNLAKLSQKFKDAVAYCLLLKGAEVTGNDSALTVPSLTSIMYEVKLIIFRHLDAASLLCISETCQEFHSISREPLLWRHLFLKNFGRRAVNNNLSQDWFHLYRDKYILNKKIQRQMNRCMPLVPPFMQRPYPPLPLPPQFQPPFVIGGDYDRDPFGGGILHPGHFPQLPRPRQHSSLGQLHGTGRRGGASSFGRRPRSGFGGFQFF